MKNILTLSIILVCSTACSAFENVYTHPALTDCALNKSVCKTGSVLSDWGFGDGLNATLDFDQQTTNDLVLRSNQAAFAQKRAFSKYDWWSDSERKS